MLRRVLAKSQAGWGTSVTGPKLYTWYSPDEAISFFGASDGAQSYCNGQWRVFPAALVCLTEIDENDPRREATKSHFVDASRFCWVADQPYRGPDGEPRYFVPPEAIAGDTRVIELFVRPPDARQYLYAGQLARSYMRSFLGAKGVRAPRSASRRRFQAVSGLNSAGFGSATLITPRSIWRLIACDSRRRFTTASAFSDIW